MPSCCNLGSKINPLFAAAGVFSLLAATEITDGVFYPMGGFCKVRHDLLAACLAVDLRQHLLMHATALP